MNVTSKAISRTWHFGFNIEPGSVPDMPPYEWSSEIIRPDQLEIEIRYTEGEPPFFVSRSVRGGKVLKDNSVSVRARREAHIFSHQPGPPWIFQLSEACLEEVSLELHKIGELARNQAGKYVVPK